MPNDDGLGAFVPELARIDTDGSALWADQETSLRPTGAAKGTARDGRPKDLRWHRAIAEIRDTQPGKPG